MSEADLAALPNISRCPLSLNWRELHSLVPLKIVKCLNRFKTGIPSDICYRCQRWITRRKIALWTQTTCFLVNAETNGIQLNKQKCRKLGIFIFKCAHMVWPEHFKSFSWLCNFDWWYPLTAEWLEQALSVTWNVLSGSGGHAFEPQLGWTLGA